LRICAVCHATPDRIHGSSMADRELTAMKLAFGLKQSAFNRLFRPNVNPDVVTYSVAPSPESGQTDKRRCRRRRTRLRSGKILDDANRFLIEASILDRSSSGLRLRLAKDCAIPQNFRLFDDETELILIARIVWRRQALIGAQIDPSGPARASQRQIVSLRGKFYAMKD
jgi:hypothetical protein